MHARVDEHPHGGAGEPHQVTGVYQCTAAQVAVNAISCKETVTRGGIVKYFLRLTMVKKIYFSDE